VLPSEAVDEKRVVELVKIQIESIEARLTKRFAARVQALENEIGALQNRVIYLEGETGVTANKSLDDNLISKGLVNKRTERAIKKALEAGEEAEINGKRQEHAENKRHPKLSTDKKNVKRKRRNESISFCGAI